MGIDIEDGFNDLRRHVGHDIECVVYGNARHAQSKNAIPWNVSLECVTCGEVLIDFDHPDVIANQPG